MGKISHKKNLADLKGYLITIIALTALSAVLPFTSSGQAPAPDVITDLASSEGATDDQQVTLIWTIPALNGNGLTQFTVEYDPVGDGFTQSDVVAPATYCTGTTAGETCTYTVSGLTNFTIYEFRVTATNSGGTSGPSNVVENIPQSCGALQDNDGPSQAGPTTSQRCFGITITGGTVSIENSPNSLSFPSTFLSNTVQHSFSNDDPTTGQLDIFTNSDDVLTVRDLSNNANGFDLTITTSTIDNGTDTIPLENLYVVSSYPDSGGLTGNDLNDLTTIDANLEGTEINEVEFADGSTNTGDIDTTITPHSDAAYGIVTTTPQRNALIATYTTDGLNFDGNLDTIPDTILLMRSTGARLARMSQALSFYLQIPADQPAGTYEMTFTLDLIIN